MEALLLSEDERQEQTHKLALRTAALAKIYKGEIELPVEVFRRVKYIYGYRSSIVHGSSKPSKGREITLAGDEKIPTVVLALRYLGMAIQVLLDQPEYSAPSRIDEELLLSLGSDRSLSGAGPAPTADE